MNDSTPLLDERSFRLTTLVLVVAQLAILALVIAGAWAFLEEHAKYEKSIQASELQSLLYSADEQTSQRISLVQSSLDALAASLTQAAATNQLRPPINALNRELGHLSDVDFITLISHDGAAQHSAIRSGYSELAQPSIERLQHLPQQGSWSIVWPQTPSHSHHIVLARVLATQPTQNKEYLWAALNLDSLNAIYLEASDATGDALWLSAEDGQTLAGKAPPANGPPAFLSLTRKLPGYPLSLHITRQKNINGEAYNSMRRQLIFSIGMASLLLLGIGYANVQDLRRRERLRKELLQANAALEERVSKRTDELEQSHREMLAFSYSISHDLRAPLRGINGFAHALREDLGDTLSTQNCDYLDRIYRASVRMGELIDELLSLANISRQPLAVQRVDLSAIARDILEDLHLTEPNRKTQFNIQPGIQVDGDDILLRNALQNLLHNAWKFTRVRELAIISVSAVIERDVLRCTIGDNGLGFDMSHAKRLFQPFQQLHGTQGFGGTGIGLASVRRIIERHGGRVWVESAQNEGARFSFDLPRRAALVRLRGVQDQS